MLTDLLSSQDIFNTPDLKTKMSILHAVDRSLDCMTISEICEKANIPARRFIGISGVSMIFLGGSASFADSFI